MIQSLNPPKFDPLVRQESGPFAKGQNVQIASMARGGIGDSTAFPDNLSGVLPQNSSHSSPASAKCGGAITRFFFVGTFPEGNCFGVASSNAGPGK